MVDYYPMSNVLRYIDLFCGIGGFRIAADNAICEYGISPMCVFSSDIDDYAREAYSHNFGELPHGDITKIKSKLIPDHDILFAGFPCQPFSIIGNGKGFDDVRGTLFFDIARILKQKRPAAFILENVKRLMTHQRGETISRILEVLISMGYNVECRVLNALDYGLPQKRERTIIVGHKLPGRFEWPKSLIDYIALDQILEKNVDKKYIASEHIRTKRKKAHQSKHKLAIWHENKSGNISSYPYSCALRAGASYNYLLVNGERRLTPRELLRLQGFPDSFDIVVPDAQVRKQAGNAVPVPLIYHVIKSLLLFLTNNAIIPNNNTDMRIIKLTNYEKKREPQITHSTKGKAAI